MLSSSRRKFLQHSSLLVTAALFDLSFNVPSKNLRLSFSTLGCPDWTFKQIVDFGVQHGYKGIEVRGLNRQMDLPLCPEFNSESNRKSTLQLMKDNGLVFVDLGSSCTLHFAEPGQRKKNLDEGKRFIDLARDLNCKYVRVFPNNFTAQNKEAVFELIISGLKELAAHAGDSVSVLIESHGDLVKADDLEKVLLAAAKPNIGMIWDITNMWAVTKEDIGQVYNRLKKYIKHVHVKDAKLTDGKINYTLLGQGDIPIMQAIDLLAKNDYDGHYSFEWEKLWHPEIAEPEIAIANYARVMKDHFK